MLEIGSIQPFQTGEISAEYGPEVKPSHEWATTPKPEVALTGIGTTGVIIVQLEKCAQEVSPLVSRGSLSP